MGLALARAMYGVAPFVADIDVKKREAALAAGARRHLIRPTQTRGRHC